jgi:hypothetical protein
MVQQTSLPGATISPKSKVVVRMEISTEVNISASVARQRANRYLITQIGDQLGATEPELVMGDQLYWRLPVQYAPSRLENLGVVGHILVDAQTGAIEIADGRTIADLQASAELLYERATPSTGA